MNWNSRTHFGSILANKPFDYDQTHIPRVRQWIVQVISYFGRKWSSTRARFGFDMDWLRIILDWFLWKQIYFFGYFCPV